jgi:FAD-dependent sensor of blue light
MQMSDMASPAIEDHALWQLAYSSAASDGFTLTDLEEILRFAREHNARQDISGMLLFEGNSFLQVPEGEGPAIDALLERIRNDRRHSRTVLLLREPIDKRSFADWTMGYTRVALGELQDATGVNDFFADQDSFADLDSAKVRKVLELFRSGSFRQRLT